MGYIVKNLINDSINDSKIQWYKYFLVQEVAIQMTTRSFGYLS